MSITTARITVVNMRASFILFTLALALCVPVRQAAAQDAPPPLVEPEPAPAPEPTPLPPSAAPAPEPPSAAPAPGRAARTLRGPAAKRVPRGPAAAPPPDLTPPNVKPFETGVDYQPTPPSTRVTFNLEDADLPELVRMMSQITGRSFILPSKARSIKATVYAPTKVTAAEAYQAFLSILELNGMALVPSGRYLKIVESGRIEGRTIPLYTGDEALPTGDRFITRLHIVKAIGAEDAAQLLERFKSADGSLTAYAPTNMLIMTDTGTNLRRMLRILDVVDVARTGEQIWVEPVHHANASELASRLSEIFETSAKSGGATPRAGRAKPQMPGAPTGGTATATIGGGESRLTKIIADERTNALIIVSTEAAYLRILEMLKHLDVSMEGEGKIHVHHLQHSSAEEIASTLSNLVSKGGQGAPGAKGADASASIFEGKVAITAHKPSNALVITSSTHDYAALRSVIDMLDSERRQVFIEAVIMELSVNRSSSLGLGYHGGVPDFPTDNSLSVVGMNAQRSIGGIVSAGNADFLTGLAVGVQGPQVTDSQLGVSIPGFGVALHAIASSGDANVLSTPHLIASDNVQAEISVGENVPLQTSAGLSSLGGLGGLAGLTGGQNNQAAALSALGGLGGLGGGAVPRQDVGTTVQITPHLNDADEIRLEISEEISAAGAPSESGNLGVRSVSRTRAKTEVVVRDQQTVVIGGLMRDQVSTGQTKVPILGDIPLLGALFRSTNKQKEKKNLLLFLTPYIIRTPDDLRAIYERKMRERQEFLDRYYIFTGAEYDAPVDYSRTRGLVARMMSELTALEDERKLLADAAAAPPLKHEPRAPVGAAPDRSSGGDGGDAPDGEVVSPADAPQAGSDAPPPPPLVEPAPADQPVVVE
jgi:general secretion pathway protein D